MGTKTDRSASLRIESPRLRGFRQAAQAGGRARIERAWSNLTAGGLPIVERIPGEPGRFRITFVWRPGRQVTTPSIYSPLVNPLRGESALLPVGRTGAWYRTLSAPKGTRGVYAFSPGPTPGMGAPGKAWGQYLRSLEADPANASEFSMPPGPDDREGDAPLTLSIASLPGAPPEPWVQSRGPSHWTVTHRSMRSRALGSERSVSVYMPEHGPPARGTGNLIVILDGLAYRTMIPAPTIVENLVASGEIGPSVLVLVGNALHARVQELAHNPAFVRFLSRELIPWLRRQFRIVPEPSRTVIAGSSLGGLTAAYAALRCPRLFGKVLAQSGAFQWTGGGNPDAPATLIREYAVAPTGRTSFYLDAGTFEGTVFPGMQMSLLTGVRYLRDVLTAKGYPVRYAEFAGGHDYVCWRGTLATGLQRLLGGSMRGRRARSRPEVDRRARAR